MLFAVIAEVFIHGNIQNEVVMENSVGKVETKIFKYALTGDVLQ